MKLKKKKEREFFRYKKGVYFTSWVGKVFNGDFEKKKSFFLFVIWLQTVCGNKGESDRNNI